MHAIVVTFDRLPLSFLGCYGNADVATPNFDRLAARSAVFDQHYADYTSAPDATHAWWTGCYQFFRRREHAAPPILPDVLRSARVSHRLLTQSAQSVPDVAETTRFEEFDDLRAAAGKILQRWSTAPDQRELLWMALDGLVSHETSPSTAAEWRDFANETIASLDDQFGRLLDSIDEAFGGECLLIVSAARGIPSVERTAGEQQDIQLWEELVHSPLWVRCPGLPAGCRFQAFTQPVDLLPTLAEWFGVARPACEGWSWLPLNRGDCRSLRDEICLGDEYDNVGVRTRDFYLVKPADSGPRLFVKPDDVWDVHDVAAQSPHDVERLSAALTVFVQTGRASTPGEMPEPPSQAVS